MQCSGVKYVYLQVLTVHIGENQINIRKSQKSSFSSGPNTKRGEGTKNKEFLSTFFLFPIDNKTFDFNDLKLFCR